MHVEKRVADPFFEYDAPPSETQHQQRQQQQQKQQKEQQQQQMDRTPTRPLDQLSL